MKLFDAHCHLQDERLQSSLAEILSSSVPEFPASLASCGTSEKDWSILEELAGKDERIVPSFGLHPWFIEERSDNWLSVLEDYLKRNKRAAIGETGLDWALKKNNELLQEGIFLSHIELAIKYSRPLSIHCRRAFHRLIPLISQGGALPRPFLVHSFSGNLQDMEKLLEIGAYFSFSGSCTYSGNKRAHRSVAAVPSDRILLETDCPDMYPYISSEEKSVNTEKIAGTNGETNGGTDSGKNSGTNGQIAKPDGWSSGKRINVPTNIIHVAEKVAQIRSVSISEIINTSFINGRNFFSLP
jgi:TatD DNase family protein